MSCQIGDEDGEQKTNIDTEPEWTIEPPDGGWGWAVCFAAFMANFTVAGINATNGLVLLGLLDIFNESVSKTSLVGSIITGTEMFGGPLVMLLALCKVSHRQIIMAGGITAAASAVASCFAPRLEVLIFTYGVCAGFSLAVSYFAVNVTLGCYFSKKRALALGIANSGSGIGSFLMSYVIEKCLTFYGTRGTYLIIAGVFLNMTVYGSLCRPLRPIIKPSHNIPESVTVSTDEGEGVTNSLPPLHASFTSEEGNTGKKVENSVSIMDSRRNRNELKEISSGTFQSEKPSITKSRCCDITIFKSKTYILLLAIFFLWAVGYSLLLYLPLYAQSVGLSSQESAMILSFYGIASTCSQIMAGFTVDVIHIPISYLLSTCLFGMSMSILSMSFCQTFATLALSTVIFSICYGFGIALRIVIVAAVLGIDRISEAYSILSSLIGVGFTIYPIVTGVLYDATHSFPLIFYMDSIIAFLGAVLSCGIIYAQKNGKFIT